MLESKTVRTSLLWSGIGLLFEFAVCYAIAFFLSSNANDRFVGALWLFGALYLFRMFSGTLKLALGSLHYVLDKRSRTDRVVALFYARKLPVTFAMVQNDGAHNVFSQLAADESLPVATRLFASEILGGIDGVKQAHRHVMAWQMQSVLEAAIARYVAEHNARTA